MYDDLVYALLYNRGKTRKLLRLTVEEYDFLIMMLAGGHRTSLTAYFAEVGIIPKDFNTTKYIKWHNGYCDINDELIMETAHIKPMPIEGYRLVFEPKE